MLTQPFLMTTVTDDPLGTEEERRQLIITNSQPSQVNVEIEGKIKNVYDIDLEYDSFSVRMHLYLRWELTQQETIRYTHDKDTFEPDIDIEVLNLQTWTQFDLIDVQCTTHESIHGKKVHLCQCKYEIRMTCAVTFDKSPFPFDCQDLPIYLRFDKSIKTDKGSVFFHVDQSNVCFGDYELMAAMAEFSQIDDHSQCIFRMKVKHNPSFYLSNYFVVVFALSLASFSVFLIESESYTDRLGLLVTLMLSYVAERFVISSSTPRVQRLTLLDKYIMYSFFFLVIFAILCTAFRGNYDDTLLIIVGSVWIVFHIVFVVVCVCTRRKQKSKLNMNTKQLQQKLRIKPFNETLKVMKGDKEYTHDATCMTFRAAIIT